MGKEWYINGWGRDNMEYWAPARAGGQCSILYTTPKLAGVTVASMTDTHFQVFSFVCRSR